MVTDSSYSGTELTCSICKRKDRSIFVYKWNVGRSEYKYPFCTECKNSYRKKLNTTQAQLNTQLNHIMIEWLQSRKNEIELQKRQIQLPLSNG